MEAFLFGISRGVSLLAFAEGMKGQPLTACSSAQSKPSRHEEAVLKGPALAHLVHAYLHRRVSQMASVLPVLPRVQSTLHTAARWEGSSHSANEIISPPSFDGSPLLLG